MGKVHSLPAKPQAAAQYDGDEFGDVFNASRFADKYRGQLIYIPQRGAWFEWDEHAWRLDEGRQVIQHAIAATKDMILEASALSIDAARAADQGSRKVLIERAESLLRAGKGAQSKPKLEAMISIASTARGMWKGISAFDRNDMLFCVQNGVIDLESGLHRDGNPDDLITKQAGCDYLGGWESVACPAWEKFLLQVQPNPNVRHWLQTFAGYCLTGRIDEQIFAVFHGHGQNGKTVFIEMLKRALGEYAATAQFNTFCATAKNDAIRNDLACLDKVRLVVACEGQDGARLDESIVKQITGGDEVTARFLLKEYFTFRPKFKIVLVTNHKPQITGTDNGIWRRVVLIPWDVTVPDSQRDKRLLDKLERELPGILAWALKGLAMYLQDGLTAPAEIVAANNEYRSDSDIVGMWLTDRCDTTDAGFRSAIADIYRSYTAWASECGHRPISRKTLGDRLSERGIRDCRTVTGDRGRQGIRLRP